MSRNPEPSDRPSPVGVLVELRVPRGLSVQTILGSPALQVGFELDTGYEPVPTTPTQEDAESLEAAGEEVVTIRGVIDEDRIPELEAQDGVIKIWRDTRVEPFG